LAGIKFGDFSQSTIYFNQILHNHHEAPIGTALQLYCDMNAKLCTAGRGTTQNNSAISCRTWWPSDYYGCWDSWV